MGCKGELFTLGTSSQQPTRKRNHGAYLLRWEAEGLLLDPGEGTQRQFIYANVAPTCVNRIFISHFHGDHCLGVGSMLMRLNLDKVTHPIHCYYPKSGQIYFNRLRKSTIYHENIEIIEHPIEECGFVDHFGPFKVFCFPLSHGIENLAFRIEREDQHKFNKELLDKNHIFGPNISRLQKEKKIIIDQKEIQLSDVTWIEKGKSFAYISDTKICENAFVAAKDCDLLLCESTYTEEHVHLAKKYKHLTAKQAATIAKKAGVKKLILTHFSARYLDTKTHLKEAKETFENTEVAEDLKRFLF